MTRPVASGLFGQSSVVEVEIKDDGNGNLPVSLTEPGINNTLSHAVSQSVEVIAKRINELGTSEPVVQRQGQDRVLVQFPGLQDPQRLKNLIGQTAKLTFHLVSSEMSAQEALTRGAPPGTKVVYRGGQGSADAVSGRVCGRSSMARIWSTRSRASTNGPTSRSSVSASTPRARRVFARRHPPMSVGHLPSFSTIS